MNFWAVLLWCIVSLGRKFIDTYLVRSVAVRMVLVWSLRQLTRYNTNQPRWLVFIRLCCISSSSDGFVSSSSSSSSSIRLMTLSSSSPSSSSSLPLSHLSFSSVVWFVSFASKQLFLSFNPFNYSWRTVLSDADWMLRALSCLPFPR